MSAAVAATMLFAVPQAFAQDESACIGLSCDGPAAVDLPSADKPLAGLSGPRDLEKQKKAGFYEFGAGTTVGKRAVAYVVPPGQINVVPDDVRELPVVQERLADPQAFETGTEVIFGPRISLYVPTEKAAAAARKGGVVRAMAAGTIGDGFNCSDYYFCIYESNGWSGRRLQFGDPGYWQNLGDYGFNDQADSYRNRRRNDSALAEHANGGGDRHCYGDQTVADSFGGWPWGFGDDASSVWGWATSAHC